MKIPLSWLREICPVHHSVEDLGDVLSARGLHVEAIDRPWEGLSGVVVGRVLEVRDHPNSDRLCLARVSDGSGERELVVGVRNMGPGDLVPLAGPGARLPTLPGPLSAREIRGVISEGMLCSPYELGISPDHGGILVLPPDLPVGADLKGALGLDESVLDLEIETNRPDLLSVVGVAREVAAAIGLRLTPPDPSVPEGGGTATEAAWVEVLDTEKCPRYLARVIRGVSVGPSPIRVQARLTAAGMRPISNVVDATNYVMLEMGHPMHPFDLDTLAGGGVVVRRAEPGERLVTLDGVERTLADDDLVIADRVRPVGIAGIMGSADGEVSSSTTTVLLESAYFQPQGIFRTYRRLMLHTEASARFSRGADPEILGPAAARAARLMVEWAGGEVLAEAIDVGGIPPRRTVSVRPTRASLVIGHEVSAADMADALGRLGIQTEKSDGLVQVDVPSFRPDLRGEIDLIEEVVRVQGYETLGSTRPDTGRAGAVAAAYALGRRIREALVRAGLREALSISFASSQDVSLMGHEAGVRVANPPSSDDPYLRTSLVPNLLRALARNAARGSRGAALFEVGRVFQPGDVVEERESVAAALTGRLDHGLYAEARNADFFDAKGALEALMDGLSIPGWQLGEAAGPPLHPARSAEVAVGEEVVGLIGELHPGVAGRFDLPAPVALFELDVSRLAAHASAATAVRDIPRFPPVHRDLAFVVDATVPAGAVGEEIASAGGDLSDSVVLFDVFTGAPIPEGKKSLAFSVAFRAPDRTLTDEEADEVVQRIVQAVAARFGAELRAG
jgi:phenylalanyl-tRNA synthetase beta chain